MGKPYVYFKAMVGVREQTSALPPYEMLLRYELILSLKAHVIFSFTCNTKLDAQLEEETGKEA